MAEEAVTPQYVLIQDMPEGTVFSPGRGRPTVWMVKDGLTTARYQDPADGIGLHVITCPCRVRGTNEHFFKDLGVGTRFWLAARPLGMDRTLITKVSSTYVSYHGVSGTFKINDPRMLCEVISPEELAQFILLGAGPRGSIKDMWQKFDRQEHLSDEEVAALIDDAHLGERFLVSRGETGGVLFKVLHDIRHLQSIQKMRARE